MAKANPNQVTFDFQEAIDGGYIPPPIDEETLAEIRRQAKAEKRKNRNEQRKLASICISCRIAQAMKYRLKCQECLRRDSEEYHRYREVGICPQCKKEPAVEGRSFCQGCLEKKRDWQNKARAKDPEKARRINRKCVNKKKADGICHWCQQESRPGRRLCKDCAIKQEEQRKLRVASGICRSCKKREIIDGKHFCQPCHEKSLQRLKLMSQFRKEAGLCYKCGKEPLDGFCYCEICYYKSKSQTYFGNIDHWKEFRDLLASQGGRCIYSGRLLSIGVDAEIDHRIPKTRGGKNEMANFQFLHTYVNRMKMDHTHEEFLSLIRDISEYKREEISNNQAIADCWAPSRGWKNQSIRSEPKKPVATTSNEAVTGIADGESEAIS
jgi:hypothetical protein